MPNCSDMQSAKLRSHLAGLQANSTNTDDLLACHCSKAQENRPVSLKEAINDEKFIRQIISRNIHRSNKYKKTAIFTNTNADKLRIELYDRDTKNKTEITYQRRLACSKRHSAVDS